MKDIVGKNRCGDVRERFDIDLSPCTCGCDSMMIYGSEQLLWLWWYML
jgi:hypothetical protein